MSDAFAPPAQDPSRHVVSIPGLEGRVAVTSPGLLSGAKVYVDGEVAKRGSGWGTHALPDGRDAKLSQIYTRTVPSLVVDGQTYQAGEAVPMFLVVLLWLPMALVAVGGLIGGAMGGGGVAVNMAVARQPWSAPVKGVAMLAVTAVTGGAWLVLASGLAVALQG